MIFIYAFLSFALIMLIFFGGYGLVEYLSGRKRVICRMEGEQQFTVLSGTDWVKPSKDLESRLIEAIPAGRDAVLLGEYEEYSYVTIDLP